MDIPNVCDFSRYGDAVAVPDLIEIQTRSYARFLQDDLAPDKRKSQGLEALLRETSQESLALHRRAGAAIESMNRELRRLQLQLRRLASARE